MDDPFGRVCCGLPMERRPDVFGIWVYRCVHRPGHPLLFINPQTGESVREDPE